VTAIRNRAIFAAAAATALLAAGCGSSGSNPTSPRGQVIRAANVTAAAKGYRFEGTVHVGITGSTSVSFSATISGAIETSPKRAAVNVSGNVLGHSINTSERISGTTYWISTAGLHNASRLTNKPWLRYDLGQTINQLGLSDLPAESSDPTQFVGYLKAVGADVRPLGTQMVKGVSTKRYAVTVNLDNYARLVPAGERAQARKSIKQLTAVIGTNELHMQAWIDDHNLARRLALKLPECIAGQHVDIDLSMDLYDYGAQTKVTLPPAADSYDISGLVSKGLAAQGGLSGQGALAGALGCGSGG